MNPAQYSTLPICYESGTTSSGVGRFCSAVVLGERIAGVLEWICPKCNRAVDPAFDTCPFCGNREIAPAAKPPGRAGSAPVKRSAARGSFWADVERGFRFGLGLTAVLALVYFLLFLVAYVQGNDNLLARLTRWLRWR